MLINLQQCHSSGEKPYKCPTCPYECRESGRLKKHIATHTGEKPYRCHTCHYSSTTCGDLKKHLMTHTGEKPFKCPSCPYSCRESGRLKKHMTTHNANAWCKKHWNQMKWIKSIAYLVLINPFLPSWPSLPSVVWSFCFLFSRFDTYNIRSANDLHY